MTLGVALLTELFLKNDFICVALLTKLFLELLIKLFWWLINCRGSEGLLRQIWRRG